MSKLSPTLVCLSLALGACAFGVDDDVATNEWPYDDSAYDEGLDASVDVSLEGSADASNDDPPEADTDAGSAADDAMDAGCTPFETEELGPCEPCGTLVRECQEDGSFSEGECVFACAPGQVENEPCGNCGTRTRSCSEACEWGEFSECEGQGECAPGEVEDDAACHPQCTVQTRTCTDSCEWGPCDLKDGAACNWNEGKTWRCCDVGKWQWCRDSCQWSTACEACSPCERCH